MLNLKEAKKLCKKANDTLDEYFVGESVETLITRDLLEALRLLEEAREIIDGFTQSLSAGRGWGCVIDKAVAWKKKFE